MEPWRSVLSTYSAPFQPSRCQPLGSAGGFSGAALWRLETPAGTLCLRRWPAEHPTRQRLAWLHQILLHVCRRNLPQVPAPFPNLHGETFLQHNGRLWELTPWMPGEANYPQAPHPEKLQAAMEILARFHIAAATLHADRGPSPGLQERTRWLRELLQGEGRRIQAAIRPSPWPELVELAHRLLSHFFQRAPACLSRLEAAAHLQAPLSPCLRDVWSDHILFRENQVTGLIDFGAMRMETVAGDLARLLSSLDDDPAIWEHGLRAYRQTRELSTSERSLIPLFAESGALLSGISWLKWIYLEGRDFTDSQSRVLARMQEILRRLEAFAR